MPNKNDLMIGNTALARLHPARDPVACIVLAIHEIASNDAWSGFAHQLPLLYACVLVNKKDAPGAPYAPSGLLPGLLALHLRVVKISDLQPVPLRDFLEKERTLSREWAGVVQLLNVVVQAPFEFEGRSFLTGSQGKLANLAFSEADRNNGRMRWGIHWPAGSSPEQHGSFGWNTPIWSAMSFSCASSGFIFQPYIPEYGVAAPPAYRPGERLIIKLRASSGWDVRTTSSQIVRLLLGDVVEVTAYPGRFKILTGMGAGHQVELGPNGFGRLIPFPHEFFAAKERVQIATPVNFRQRNIQDLMGVVLLQTDIDGDVGVEFDEDLGAGSLDGIGASGHCLLVPAHTVKKIAE